MVFKEPAPVAVGEKLLGASRKKVAFRLGKMLHK
jgi:hypothetical protein